MRFPIASLVCVLGLLSSTHADTLDEVRKELSATQNEFEAAKNQLRLFDARITKLEQTMPDAYHGLALLEEIANNRFPKAETDVQGAIVTIHRLEATIIELRTQIAARWGTPAAATDA